jgi:hypothetical protein
MHFELPPLWANGRKKSPWSESEALDMPWGWQLAVIDVQQSDGDHSASGRRDRCPWAGPMEQLPLDLAARIPGFDCRTQRQPDCEDDHNACNGQYIKLGHRR